MSSLHPLDKIKADHAALMARFDSSPAMKAQKVNAVLENALGSVNNQMLVLQRINYSKTDDQKITERQPMGKD